MVAAGDPVNAADLTTDEDYTIRRPLVRLVQAVTQSIPNNVNTALTFTTEDIDTNGFHDNVTNNDRVTPTVSGYYKVTGTYATPTSTSELTVQLTLTKNGTGLAPSCRMTFPATSPTGAITAHTDAIFSANGTTDYFNMLALQNSGTPSAQNTQVGSVAASCFEVEFLRPL